MVGVFLLSMLPVIFHKNIYWFRNYKSRRSRILLGLAWLFIPSNLIGGYFHFQGDRELRMKYELNRERFMRMLEVGDINMTNPHQEWVDY